VILIRRICATARFDRKRQKTSSVYWRTRIPFHMFEGLNHWTDDERCGMMGQGQQRPPSWLVWAVLMLALLVWASLLQVLGRATPIVWETAVLKDSNPPSTGSVTGRTSDDSGTTGGSAADEAPR